MKTIIAEIMTYKQARDMETGKVAYLEPDSEPVYTLMDLDENGLASGGYEYYETYEEALEAINRLKEN